MNDNCTKQYRMYSVQSTEHVSYLSKKKKKKGGGSFRTGKSIIVHYCYLIGTSFKLGTVHCRLDGYSVLCTVVVI
jgi:hypothetical protein